MAGMMWFIFKEVDTEKKLVIAGGSSDSEDYVEKLHEMAKDDPRIIFTGFVQGQLLEELYTEIYCIRNLWWMTVGIAVALVAPFIMYALERLDTRRIFFLVFDLILFFSFHQTFIKVSVTLDTTQGYGFIWACCLLVIGHWIHRIQDEVISKIPAAVYLMGYILISCAIFTTNYLIVKFDIAQVS